MFYGYVPQDSDERKVINTITEFALKDKYYPDLTFFHNLLFDPVRFEGIEEYNGFYLAKNILRDEIGLERKGKPGDYDILFIPYNQKRMFYERTAVFEVKIARPTFQLPNKGSNSLGETQVYGLIDDGFPLIGLLHIVISKPLLLRQTSTIKVSKVPSNTKWDRNNPPFKSVEDLFEDQPWDWLPSYSIDKQMTRLIRIGFPKYVGLNTFALTKDSKGERRVIMSEEFRGFTSGYFNPKTSLTTIEKVETHFLKFKNERYRKIEMWPLNIR